MTGLSRRRLLGMRAAGREVLRCYGALADGRSNLVLDFLRGTGPFETLRPYPLEGVHDLASRSGYYYHAHREGEHGHFHTFVHLPEGATAHLVAVRVDDRGVARGLFTVNRWVTGERFPPAREVSAMLARFAIDHASPSWLVNRWITAMLRLFRPQIERLLTERDRALERRARRHPGVDPLEDRDLEVLSELSISIDRQVAAIERALRVQPRT